MFRVPAEHTSPADVRVQAFPETPYLEEVDGDVLLHMDLVAHNSGTSDLEVSRIICIGDLSEFPTADLNIPAVVVELMEEAGWRLGRTDLNADTYMRDIREAAVRVDAAVSFPKTEDVAPFAT